MNNTKFTQLAENLIKDFNNQIISEYANNVIENIGAILVIASSTKVDVKFISEYRNSDLYDCFNESQKERISKSNKKGDKIFVIVNIDECFIYVELDFIDRNRLLIHQFNRTDINFRNTLFDDFTLYFTNLNKWIKSNKFEELSVDESESNYAILLAEIENKKYVNEFLMTSIFFYTYAIFGKIQRDKDGFNTVTTENMIAKWDNEISKKNALLIIDMLLEFFQTIFEEVLPKQDCIDFDLDIIRFGKIYGSGDSIRFEHNKNINEFDNFIGIMSK